MILGQQEKNTPVTLLLNQNGGYRGSSKFSRDYVYHMQTNSDHSLTDFIRLLLQLKQDATVREIDFLASPVLKADTHQNILRKIAAAKSLEIDIPIFTIGFQQETRPAIDENGVVILDKLYTHRIGSTILYGNAPFKKTSKLTHKAPTDVFIYYYYDQDTFNVLSDNKAFIVDGDLAKNNIYIENTSGNLHIATTAKITAKNLCVFAKTINQAGDVYADHGMFGVEYWNLAKNASTKIFSQNHETPIKLESYVFSLSLASDSKFECQNIKFKNHTIHTAENSQLKLSKVRCIPYTTEIYEELHGGEFTILETPPQQGAWLIHKTLFNSDISLEMGGKSHLILSNSALSIKNIKCSGEIQLKATQISVDESFVLESGGKCNSIPLEDGEEQPSGTTIIKAQFINLKSSEDQVMKICQPLTLAAKESIQIDRVIDAELANIVLRTTDSNLKDSEGYICLKPNGKIIAKNLNIESNWFIHCGWIWVSDNCNSTTIAYTMAPASAIYAPHYNITTGISLYIGGLIASFSLTEKSIKSFGKRIHVPAAPLKSDWNNPVQFMHMGVDTVKQMCPAVVSWAIGAGQLVWNVKGNYEQVQSVYTNYEQKCYDYDHYTLEKYPENEEELELALPNILFLKLVDKKLHYAIGENRGTISTFYTSSRIPLPRWFFDEMPTENCKDAFETVKLSILKQLAYNKHNDFYDKYQMDAKTALEILGELVRSLKQGCDTVSAGVQVAKSRPTGNDLTELSAQVRNTISPEPAPPPVAEPTNSEKNDLQKKQTVAEKKSAQKTRASKSPRTG